MFLVPCRLWIGLRLVSVGCTLAAAGLLSAATMDWSVQGWGTNALPSSYLTGLAQTPDGFIWIASPTHLVRFDGLRFESFSPAELPGAGSVHLESLATDSGGRLWAASRGGNVFCFDGARTRIYSTGVISELPSALAADDTGGIWVGYAQGPVVRVQDGLVTRFGSEHGVGKGAHRLACEHGRVWLVQSNALCVLRPGGFEPVMPVIGRITGVAPAAGGGIWLMRGNELWKVAADGAARDLGGAPIAVDSLPEAILEDRFGAVWVGTHYSGIWRFFQGQWEQPPSSGPRISALLQDREGNIWVGMSGGGLNRLSSQTATLLGDPIAAPLDEMRGLCEDSSGVIWAARLSGQVARWRDNRWETPPGVKSIRAAASLAAGPAGEIWVGTNREGLIRLENGQISDWRPPAPVTGLIKALLLARSGDLWMLKFTFAAAPAHKYSVQKLARGRLTTLENPGDYFEPLGIAEDAGGKIWISTHQGGIWAVNGDDRLVETPAARAPPGSRIYRICGSEDGSLWLAYTGSGLGRLKGGVFTRVRAQDGLADDNIFSLSGDGRGSIWCLGATAGSLFKVSAEEVDRFARGQTAKIRSVQCTDSDHLPHFFAAVEDLGGALLRRSGQIWFPVGSAVAVVNSRNLQDITEPSPVIITRLAVDGADQAVAASCLPQPARGGVPVPPVAGDGRPLKLTPGPHLLRFEYASLSFSAPENRAFQTRLLGASDQWSPPSPQGYVDFPGLKPGAYRFEVKGRNSGGVWNDAHPATLAFVISPYFWQRWEFQTAAGAIAAAAIFAVALLRARADYRMRMRELEAQSQVERERGRIARDIHDDIGNRLTQIMLMAELARRDCAELPAALSHLRQMEASTHEVLNSLEEIIWAVNPRNDTLAQLLEHMNRFALDFLRQAAIRCRFAVPVPVPDCPLTADQRYNLFLAVKEALTNVVRHAGASEVDFSVTLVGGVVIITIADNGRGFAAAPADATSDGLRNLRVRMDNVGGRLGVTSSPGSGTRVALEFPLPRRD